MNTERLKGVAKRILKHPDRLYMDYWSKHYDLTNSFIDWMEDGKASWKKVRDLDCGTAACIAGHAVGLYFEPTEDRVMTDDSYSKIATELLEVDPNQSRRLFNVNHWPDKHRLKYSKARTPKGRARVTHDRIQHFIKTKGEE